MIGGTDVTMPTLAGPSAIDLAVRLVRMRWPRAVFEDAINGTVFRKYADLPFRYLREIFVYRDEDARQTWDDLGADPSHANTMVHLLISSSTLTVVVDSLDDANMKEVVDAIASGLRTDILTMTAQMRVAA
jgi:hypothetical protein